MFAFKGHLVIHVHQSPTYNHVDKTVYEFLEYVDFYHGDHFNHFNIDAFVEWINALCSKLKDTYCNPDKPAVVCNDYYWTVESAVNGRLGDNFQVITKSVVFTDLVFERDYSDEHHLYCVFGIRPWDGGEILAKTISDDYHRRTTEERDLKEFERLKKKYEQL